MQRRIKLGFKATAVGTDPGIVLGLYNCHGKNSDQALGWSEGFPTETAAHAVETLARESTARQGSAWHLPDGFRKEVPDGGYAPARLPEGFSDNGRPQRLIEGALALS
jgi:hypothetical protein